MNSRKKLDCFPFCDVPGRRTMQRQRLPDLDADAQCRIKGAESVLGDISHPVAAHGATLTLCHVNKGLASQQDAPGLDARASRQHAESGQGSQRLAAPGFADHPHDLAGANRKADIIDDRA
jgi:hypothetical protein